VTGNRLDGWSTVERYGLGVGSGSVRMIELVDLFVSFEIDVVGVTRLPGTENPPVTDGKSKPRSRTGNCYRPAQDTEITRRGSREHPAG